MPKGRAVKNDATKPNAVIGVAKKRKLAQFASAARNAVESSESRADNAPDGPRLVAAVAPVETASSIKTQQTEVTPFQRRVYALCSRIPKGRVATYGSISRQLGMGNTHGPRAVGNALRRNPFAPTVPCHRVVASDGTIGGYSGETKLDSDLITKKVNFLREEGVVFKKVQRGKKLVLLLENPEEVLFNFESDNR